MKILGIETSCDETGASVIEANEETKKVNLLSNVVTSSLALHAKTGGVIPEKAAREQVKYIIPVIKQAIEQCNNVIISDIDAIAVTVGPGLIGSLLVGVETAKTISYVWKKPLIPVNHLIGHIYANFIDQNESRGVVSVDRAPDSAQASESSASTGGRETDDRTPSEIMFPTIGLIVSGGHTDLILMKKHGSITWLGGTRDDAAGEALDKIGRLLSLPYPGGPYIEKSAKNGNPKRFSFPRPLIDSKDFDFSFSGLKTAVLREIQRGVTRQEGFPTARKRVNRQRALAGGNVGAGPRAIVELNNQTIADLSAAVQKAIIDVLVSKTLRATQQFSAKSILLGGGVAANETLRTKLNSEVRSQKLEVEIFFPDKNLCTDNAAMIATAAFYNYKPIDWQKVEANPELYFD